MNRRHIMALTLSGLIAAPALLRAADVPIERRNLYNKDPNFFGSRSVARRRRGHGIGLHGVGAQGGGRVLRPHQDSDGHLPVLRSAAQWPDDILAVHTQRIVRPIPFGVAIETRGPLELGAKRDAETGFIGRMRVVDAVCS